MLSVKTDRQMAAARAEQGEQREREEFEFHLVLSRSTGIEEAPTTCVGIAGASFVPRPADRSGPTQTYRGIGI
jgi:hypothetical protein